MSEDNINLNNKKVGDMSEKEVLEWAGSLNTQYIAMAKKMVGEYNHLIKIKRSFPVRYIKSESYDDLVLKAADAKWQAIELLKGAAGLSSDVKFELEYLTSNFKLNIADDALSEKFDKVTEGLREAFVNSKMELKEMARLRLKIEILSDSAERLIKMFESDEINFRRIVDKQTKVNGF